MKITKKICLHCNNEFEKVASDSYDYFINRRKYCTFRCSTEAQKGKSVSVNTQFKKGETSGEKNHFWRGGKYKSSQGYIVVWTPTGRKLEHRHVMEQHIGRKLGCKEHVHHLNHDKTDNRIENLEILDIADHGRLHSNERWHKTGAF